MRTRFALFAAVAALPALVGGAAFAASSSSTTTSRLPPPHIAAQSAPAASASACEQDAREVRSFLSGNAGRMDRAEQRDARRRVDIASRTCGQLPQLAQANLAGVRADLGMTAAQQQAEMPAEAPAYTGPSGSRWMGR